MNTDMKKEYISDLFVADRDVYESTIPDPSVGSKGILRTVTGPVAEWDSLNRNKRKYSEKLWDNTLASPYVTEQLRYHTLYGEPNHPPDRMEVEFSRVSHSIEDMWKVPANNQIYAKIHILDTPMGRILNTLYEAGGIIGYSSRAGGILHNKKDYIDVDENAYNFVTFDAVPFPSVQSARPADIVAEGAETPKLAMLSEDAHQKLAAIINESSEKMRDSIKDFIYSIEGWDLTREKELFEHKEENDMAKENQTISETTLSLLKESSLQINELKASVQTLTADNQKLTSENGNLKSRLDESLNRVTELMESAKTSSEDSTPNKYQNTISDMKDRIEEMKQEMEDKDVELLELQSIKEAFNALQSENKGLKSIVHSDDKSLKEIEKLREELNEAYTEMKSLVVELNEMTHQVEELSKIEPVDEGEILRLNQTINTLRKENTSLKRVNRNLKEDKKSLVNESKSLDAKLESSTSKVHNLEESNEGLRNKLHSLHEAVKDANLSSNANDKVMEQYKMDLVSVICSGYNLNTSDVMKHLNEGFTKSDIYCVCEEMSNSKKNGVDYSSVVSESADTTGVKPIETNNKTNSNLNALFSANRRGVGLLK